MKQTTKLVEAPENCSFCGSELVEIFLENDQSAFACRMCELGYDF